MKNGRTYVTKSWCQSANDSLSLKMMNEKEMKIRDVDDADAVVDGYDVRHKKEEDVKRVLHVIHCLMWNKKIVLF